MTIANEISRLQDAKTSIKQAIVNKGVSVPNNLTLDGYACCINKISTEIPFPTFKYLIVGGGGGGGSGRCYYYGSGAQGGSGGKVCCGTKQPSLTGTYTITVGAGGASYTCCWGCNGGASMICYDGTCCICATGGCGGKYSINSDYTLGGGSGAGGAASGLTGGPGCFGYGGGGGGAGYACYLDGEICPDNFIRGGKGRDGGGDGGVSHECSCRDFYGCPGTTCGSGGGGANYNRSGGSGAGGLVEICYLPDGSCGFKTATGGNNCFICNGFCVHRFTSSGTFKITG